MLTFFCERDITEIAVCRFFSSLSLSLFLNFRSFTSEDNFVDNLVPDFPLVNAFLELTLLVGLGVFLPKLALSNGNARELIVGFPTERTTPTPDGVLVVGGVTGSGDVATFTGEVETGVGEE